MDKIYEVLSVLTIIFVVVFIVTLFFRALADVTLIWLFICGVLVGFFARLIYRSFFIQNNLTISQDYLIKLF